MKIIQNEISDSSDSSRKLGVRLFHAYIKQHVVKLVIAASCMAIAATATAAHAWLMQPVVNEIFVNGNEKMLVPIALAVLILAIVKGVATYIHSVSLAFVGQRSVTDMQLSLYEHLLFSDVAMFSAEASGRLISRFSNDINIIRRNLVHIMTGIAKESVTLVLLVGLMFYQSIELALIAFVVFPVAIYPIIRLGKRMRKVSSKTQEELAHFTSKLDDTFQGVRIVKSYSNESYEIGRAKGVMESIFRLYMKAARIFSMASPIMETLAGASIAAVIWYGGYQVIEGATTPGAFFSFITAMLMAYRPLKNLSGINMTMQEAMAALKRYFDMMDTKPEIKDSEEAKELRTKNNDVEIEFKDVVFSYHYYKNLFTEETETNPALKGVSLKVPSGKRIALVGTSGGGKSTIMNLILRFYDPSGGEITINGTNIKDLKIASLRQNIAIVTQESTLFDDTIKTNICYGKKDATEEEIIEAAKSAAAHDFILEQPEGYDTFIGQRGVRLSGGQKQRIAIARAMLKNAPILLLDEATSSLDTVSEQQIQSALDKLMAGRTTVVIAHRLSTIQNADVIYVVENGSIVEHGTHKTLIAKKGAYSKLYERQFADNKEPRWSKDKIKSTI